MSGKVKGVIAAVIVLGGVVTFVFLVRIVPVTNECDENPELLTAAECYDEREMVTVFEYLRERFAGDEEDDGEYDE